MKTHVIKINEEDWPASKYNSREWERRVNVISWEHDYSNGVYTITIKIK